MSDDCEAVVAAVCSFLEVAQSKIASANWVDDNAFHNGAEWVAIDQGDKNAEYRIEGRELVESVSPFRPLLE